jgi:hypothetical protein
VLNARCPLLLRLHPALCIQLPRQVPRQLDGGQAAPDVPVCDSRTRYSGSRRAEVFDSGRGTVAVWRALRRPSVGHDLVCQSVSLGAARTTLAAQPASPIQPYPREGQHERRRHPTRIVHLVTVPRLRSRPPCYRACQPSTPHTFSSPTQTTVAQVTQTLVGRVQPG